jgi:hypothetical protein
MSAFIPLCVAVILPLWLQLSLPAEGNDTHARHT